MAGHESDIFFFFFLYGEGMREKEGLKGGIKTAIFVDIH
jgi:hypothetical protein